MHISDGFQIELLSAPCSDRPHYIYIYSRMRTLYVYVSALSESHSFQANR